MVAEESERKARLQKIRDAGDDPFPAHINRTHTWALHHASFEDLIQSQDVVNVVGRVRAVRRHGKLAFVCVQDGSGEGQLLVKFDAVGGARFEELLGTIDLGDFVEAEGVSMRTKSGEESVAVTRMRVIAKAILPLPEKWHGLSDTETRFRERELDLIANPSVRKVFEDRGRIVTAMRHFFDARGFLEVDTPMLQHVAAGASAKPFLTHHEALGEDMYLRIAPELFLKRCVIGGFERVYEVARCFRNEGIDHAHNPEFTQLEAYAAYMEYEELMRLMEELVVQLVSALSLDVHAVPFDSHVLSFKVPFAKKTFRDAIFDQVKVDIDEIHDIGEARHVAQALGLEVEEAWTLGTIFDTIFKKTVRSAIVQPTFIIDYPAAITPLAKRRADNPERIEMFQLVMGGGLEIMKAFTELNDPLDQEARMQEQEEAHEGGDDDAQRRDDDFLRAMKHGMPPMAGVGIGIERITQVLTNSHNIKEVILFPTLKSETKEEAL